MKKAILLLSLIMFIIKGTYAQHLKKDGTTDMRYKENKGACFSPGSRGTNSDVRYQEGYQKTNGTVVEPHYKTNNNSTNTDNFSTKDNNNSFTGKRGSRPKDYSGDAKNYGKGKTINEGPRGGQYYENNNGKKVYVPKR